MNRQVSQVSQVVHIVVTYPVAYITDLQLSLYKNQQAVALFWREKRTHFRIYNR